MDNPGLLDKFPYIGIFMFLVLGGLGLPFPEEIVLIIAGAAVAGGAIKLGPAIIVVFPSLLIADVLLYSSGKKYGRPLIQKGRLGWFMSPEQFAWLESAFKRKSFYFMLFGRSVVVLRQQIFLMAGVTGMPLKRFLMLDSIAASISMLIMMGLGYMAGNSLKFILQDFTRVEHFLILIAVGSFCVWIVVRFYRSQSWRLRKNLHNDRKGQHQD